MITDRVFCQGEFVLREGPGGRILFQDRNKITTVGLQAICKVLAASHPVNAGVSGSDPLKLAYPRHIGFGTGTNAPAAGDTALQTPANSAGTSTFKEITAINFPSTTSVQYVCLYSVSEANHPANLTEAGIFAGVALSGDPPAIGGLTLIARRTGFSIPKTNAAPLQVEWTFTVSEAP